MYRNKNMIGLSNMVLSVPLVCIQCWYYHIFTTCFNSSFEDKRCVAVLHWLLLLNQTIPFFHWPVKRCKRRRIPQINTANINQPWFTIMCLLWSTTLLLHRYICASLLILTGQLLSKTRISLWHLWHCIGCTTTCVVVDKTVTTRYVRNVYAINRYIP